jgi:hypothetical protein
LTNQREREVSIEKMDLVNGKGSVEVLNGGYYLVIYSGNTHNLPRD